VVGLVSEHVLVVEDNGMLREHVVGQIGALGYRVSAASNGSSALEIIRDRTDIDLLFTDIVMPGGMSGYELAEAARTIRPELRILYTSGYNEISSGGDGPLSEGGEMLPKPYRRQELASRLRNMFEG